MPPVAHHAVLVCHAEYPSKAVRAIGVSVRRTDGELAISYTIEGELARLRVPPAVTPRMGRDLWKHTCCECFVALEDQPAYHELNFSPSGVWAAHAFSKYREGGPLRDEALDPRIAVRRSAEGLALEATVAIERLSPRYRDGALVLGLSAVIEDVDGGLSYWALRHPAGKPDFHQRDAFALRIEPQA